MEKNTLPPSSFVVDRLKVGILQSEVKQNLITIGWKEEDAESAIAAGLLALGAPAPQAGTRLGIRQASSTLDVVLNFFSFILLSIIATALGTLYYQIINKWIPDPLAFRSGMGTLSTSSAQYAIAALIVAFPFYVFVLRLWFKRFRENAERIESKLTKWLTYLVLLVSSITIIGDLIVAIFYFLQGELSARFFLKALTIFIIAGTILGFYVLERRKVQYGQDIPRNVFMNFAYGVGAFVLLGIILGFMASGSPKTERMRGLDGQRSADLAQIAQCINNFSADRKRLPNSLEELQTSTNYQYCASRITDPETGMPYTYRILEATKQNGSIREGTYELCAVFLLENTKDNPSLSDQSYPMAVDNKWGIHGIGDSCDTETTVLEGQPLSIPPVSQKILLQNASIPPVPQKIPL